MFQEDGTVNVEGLRQELLSAWQGLVAGRGIIRTIFRKKYLEQMHIDE